MEEGDAPKSSVPVPPPRQIIRSNTTVTSQEKRHPAPPVAGHPVFIYADTIHANDDNDDRLGNVYSYLDMPVPSENLWGNSFHPTCPPKVTHLVRSNTTVPGHPERIFENLMHVNDDRSGSFESGDLDVQSSFSGKQWKSSFDLSKSQNSIPPPAIPARTDLPPIPPRITPRQSMSPNSPLPSSPSGHRYDSFTDIFKQNMDSVKDNYVDMSGSHIIQDGSNLLDFNDVSESIVKQKMGWLQKLGKSSNSKGSADWKKFWCTVDEKVFNISTEKDMIPINSVLATGILKVAKKLDIVQKNNMNLYCFNIVDTIQNSGQARLHIFGASSAQERDNWIASIWMCITPSKKVADSMTSADKSGRFEYKESVSGIWRPAWLGLLNRNLELWVDYGAKHINVDLRKVKSLCHLAKDPAIESSADRIKGTVFSLAYEGMTIYLRSPVSSETDDTFKLVVTARNTIGTEIEDQFLTKNDTPVLVDLCLKHIFVHGLTIDGIYTQDVQQSRVESLLKILQTDPYNVKLSSHEYTVHEFAGCLKLFFSKFAEPLLSDKLAAGWRAAYAAHVKDRVTKIEPLIQWLTPVQYQTLRLLLLHLSSVCKCQERNSMSELRIASVFGPILIGETNECYKSFDNADVGMKILSCLLQNFVTLFKITEAELEHEATCLQFVLQEREKVSLSKLASDNGIMVTVVVDHQLCGKYLAFKVLSTMTARNVCEQLMIDLNRPVRIENVILCEVVCNNELVRPIHFSELVFEVLLRWKNWNKNECLKNFLLFKYDDVYKKIMPHVPINPSISKSGEVRLADAKAKSSFKKVCLKFERVLSGTPGEISFLKDSMATKLIGKWRINDVTWYIGSETRRQAPTKFAITFIERIVAVQRTKSRPYFGFTVCMKTEEDLLKWMAVMMKGEYPNGILPT